jgi:acetylglutamate kinase
VAVALADSLKATKLIFVTSRPGLLYRGRPIRQMLVTDLANSGSRTMRTGA